MGDMTLDLNQSPTNINFNFNVSFDCAPGRVLDRPTFRRDRPELPAVERVGQFVRRSVEYSAHDTKSAQPLLLQPRHHPNHAPTRDHDHPAGHLRPHRELVQPTHA